MEVVAFFLLFAVTNYVVSGNNKKSTGSDPKTKPSESSVGRMARGVCSYAVTKMQGLSVLSSEDDSIVVPDELSAARDWDLYETPAYRRR